MEIAADMDSEAGGDSRDDPDHRLREQLGVMGEREVSMVGFTAGGSESFVAVAVAVFRAPRAGAWAGLDTWQAEVQYFAHLHVSFSKNNSK